MSDGSKKKVEEDEAVIACIRSLYVMVNLITNSCRLSQLSHLCFFLFNFFPQTFCPWLYRSNFRTRGSGDAQGMGHDEETLSSN